MAGLAGPVLIAGLATLLAGVVQIATNGSIYDVVLLFGINAIMVVGFQSFVGNTGVVSFGHVAFMALGAYAAGVVSVPVTLKSVVLPTLPHFLATTQLPMLPSLLVGGIAAAIVGMVSGVAILRLSGAAASIATLGVLVIVNNVLSNASEFTRGPQAFFGVTQTTNFAWVFISLVVVVAISAWLKWSAVGLRARAVRDDAVAAEASGVRRVPSRLWPFVLSSFITGIGGALYAHDLTAFSPNGFFVPQIVGVLTMSILGGLNSISGALAGSALISFLNEGLRRLEGGVTIGSLHIGPAVGISQAVLGVVLIAMLRWRPGGLLEALELELDPRPLRFRRSREAGTADAADPHLAGGRPTQRPPQDQPAGRGAERRAASTKTADRA